VWETNTHYVNPWWREREIVPEMLDSRSTPTRGDPLIYIVTTKATNHAWTLSLSKSSAKMLVCAIPHA
jgi:hypothetical protein